jgi:hypothetical protein
VEIFVRAMRHKNCHQAHNAKVVICALFTTPNSLKSQEPRKAFSPIRNRKSCTRTHSRQIPAASDAPPRHTSRGFLHWRFAYAGPGARRATIIGPASANLHKPRDFQLKQMFSALPLKADLGRDTRRRYSFQIQHYAKSALDFGQNAEVAPNALPRLSIN